MFYKNTIKTISKITTLSDHVVYGLFIDCRYVIAGIHYVAIDFPNQQIAREMFCSGHSSVCENSIFPFAPGMGKPKKSCELL